MKLYRILTIIILLPAAAAVSQDQGDPSVNLPPGFHGIDLGMELEQVKELLLKDELFYYRGDPDVSFLPLPKQTLIECPGKTYISRAYFQFEQEKLFIMILVLNIKEVDYFSMFTTLSEKYGQPDYLNPSAAVWSSEEIRLSLEKPLTIKYIHLPVFNQLQDQGK
ncbi:MAG: hypothetical protein GH155_04970 [Spirochaeta sp.]|nr:hypothetical protein [Spirochaeta sp.]